MEIFISWSRSRSRLLAELLKAWIEDVVPLAKPWHSLSLEAGIRWSLEVAAKLDAADFGIICMTPENLHAPWLHFEAGAISGRLGSKRTCPVLFGVSPRKLPATLSQFQAIPFGKPEMWRLTRDLNLLVGDERERSWERAFEKFWPDLKREVDAVLLREDLSPLVQGLEDLATCAQIITDIAERPAVSKRQATLVREQIRRVAKSVHEEAIELKTGRFYTSYWNCTILTESIASMKDRLLGMTIWEQDRAWWKTEDAARFLEINATKSHECDIARIFVYSTPQVPEDMAQELDKHRGLGAQVYLIHRDDIREVDCRTCALIDDVLYYHAERDETRGIDRNVFFIDKRKIGRRQQRLQATLARARRWSGNGERTGFGSP